MKENTRYRSYYKFLRDQAIMWDTLDYDQLNFTDRIAKKYGPDYFYNRYYFTNQQYYYDTQREKLDNVNKMINLEKHNQKLAEENNHANDDFAPLMQVPHSRYSLWQSLVPSEYLNDYALRKQILDAYINSLPSDKQLDAIKTMCLNDLSKNYLAFLDLTEDKLNPAQKVLFEELLDFYRNQYQNDAKLKHELAQRIMQVNESIENAQPKQVKVDFLNNDRSNLDNVQAQRTRDEDMLNQLKNMQRLIEDEAEKKKLFASNKQSIDNQTNQTQNINNKELAANIQWTNKDVVNNVSNEVNNMRNLGAKIDDINRMINQSLNNPNLNNNNQRHFRDVYQQQNVPQAKVNFNAFQTPYTNNQALRDKYIVNNTNNGLYKNNQNALMVNKQFNYTDYVKSPITYNIQDLIENRHKEMLNNEHIVQEMIESTIYYNNQYANANVKYSPAVIKNNASIHANNSTNVEQTDQKVSLSSITNKNPMTNDTLNNMGNVTTNPNAVKLIKIDKRQVNNKEMLNQQANKNLNLNLNLREEEKFNFGSSKPVVTKQPIINQKVNMSNQNRFVNQDESKIRTIPSVKLK